MLSARAEQALERFQEDERLTAAVSDAAAAALLQWIEQQVAAADTLDDAQFAERVAAIRTAARTTAQAASDDPAALPAQADAALRGAAKPATDATIEPPPLRADAAEQARTAAALLTPAPQPALPEPAPSDRAASMLDVAGGATAEAAPRVAPNPPRTEAPPRQAWWRALRRRVRTWTHRKDQV